MTDQNSVRLLVVAEKSSYFELIKEQAELCSHELSIICKYANSRKAAMTSLKDFAPSVVMLDVHLPGSNAFEVLMQCQQRDASVIITSEHHSPDIERSARERGAMAYMTNTENPEEIEALLQKISTLPDHAAVKH